MDAGLMLAVLSAVLVVIISGIGSSWGVGWCGEISSGLVAEDPEKFGKTLLLQVIPGTQGIYGFLMAFWVMLKINLLGGVVPVSTEAGLMILLICLTMGGTCVASGFFQVKTVVAGLALVGRRPEEAGKGLVFAAMVETYQLLALLTAILLINGIPL